MKITVSKHERITFTPEVEDKKATEKARQAVPPEERDDVEAVLVPADYTLQFWPLTLREEEEVIRELQNAPKSRDGEGVAVDPAVGNRLIAKKLCGWTGIHEDDAGEVPSVFDPKWDGEVPDEVIQGFDHGTRQAAFAWLLKQAMGDEETTGKSE